MEQSENQLEYFQSVPVFQKVETNRKVDSEVQELYQQEFFNKSAPEWIPVCKDCSEISKDNSYLSELFLFLFLIIRSEHLSRLTIFINFVNMHRRKHAQGGGGQLGHINLDF